MRRRTVVAAVLVWAGVVAATSGVTWVVIDAAGQQVLSQDAPLPLPVATAATSPVDLLPPTELTASAGPADEEGPTGADSSPRAGSSLSSEPSPSSPVSSESPEPPAASPLPAARERTWQGAAGTVAVRCLGGDASLRSASPSDGYGVEIGSRGPSEVEVTFRTRGDPDTEVHVKAVCVAGAPSFTSRVEADSE